jgi:hypothetical protein
LHLFFELPSALVRCRNKTDTAGEGSTAARREASAEFGAGQYTSSAHERAVEGLLPFLVM